jgi:hypothetical protein
MKSKKKQVVYEWRKDISLFVLLFSSIIYIFIAHVRAIDSLTLLKVYWMGLIISGIFSYFRISKMSGKEMKGLIWADGYKCRTPDKKTIQLFLKMYSILMLIFFILLSLSYHSSDLLVIIVIGIGFVTNHLYTFKTNQIQPDMKAIATNQLFRISYLLLIILFMIFFQQYAVIPAMIVISCIDLYSHISQQK